VITVTHDVTLASRADRVLHLQDGKFRLDRRVRAKKIVDIENDGRVVLPRELLAEAMMDDRAIAEVVDEGIMLKREHGDA
jgi:energy-coupling factor transporter ATP-binding protein EcfA2